MGSLGLVGDDGFDVVPSSDSLYVRPQKGRACSGSIVDHFMKRVSIIVGLFLMMSVVVRIFLLVCLVVSLLGLVVCIFMAAVISFLVILARVVAYSYLARGSFVRLVVSIYLMIMHIMSVVVSTFQMMVSFLVSI